MLIKQLSDLMTSLELVEDGEDLEEDLGNNELFKRDIKNILCYITPYIPLVGLVCGGICLGKHILKRGRTNRGSGKIFITLVRYEIFKNFSRPRKLSGRLL